MIKNLTAFSSLFFLFSCGVMPPAYISELDDGAIKKGMVYVIRDTGSTDRRSPIEVKLNGVTIGNIQTTEIALAEIKKTENTLYAAYEKTRGVSCIEISKDFISEPNESYFFIIFNQSHHSNLPACIKMYQTNLENFLKTRNNALTRGEEGLENVVTSFIGEVILGL